MAGATLSPAPRQAVILVGGLGTRLGELTATTPKPLLPVAGKPFLHHLLEKASATGLEDILLLAGYRAEVLLDDLERSAVADRLRLRIGVRIEAEPLGTGGALAAAWADLEDSFLLLNGDTWFDFDWRRLWTEAPHPAAIALRPAPAEDRYETVELKDGRAAAFLPRGTAARGAWINGGVYRLAQRHVPQRAGAFSLEADVLPRLASDGVLGAVCSTGEFVDIGVPDSYARAQILLAGRPSATQG